MHCIECGEFLKNIRAKEKIQLECSKCGWNFSMSSTNEKVPDTNGFDIQITIPVTVKVSGDWPIEPEKRVMSVNEDEIQYLSLHCIFCKQTLKGKMPLNDSIELLYTCNPCKNIYHVSFMTKEVGSTT